MDPMISGIPPALGSGSRRFPLAHAMNRVQHSWESVKDVVWLQLDISPGTEEIELFNNSIRYDQVEKVRHVCV